MTRRQLMGLLGATALTGCAPAIPTAQLGDDPFEGGIGGTGIVGLMTGAGSVLVNGLRVEVPSATRITVAGRTASDAALVPGAALSIVARSYLDRFEARHIDVDVPLVGILQRQPGGFVINATPLVLDGRSAPASLVGRRVAASGVWQADGRLRTSLIHAAHGDDIASGVLALRPDTGWRIGQTPVIPPRDLRLRAGQFVVARGVFTDGALDAASIQGGRFRQGGDSIRQLSVEGYLEPVASAPGFAVSGLGHSFDQRLALDPFAARRALYFGPYDGRFRARRAVLLPEDQGQRRALLRPDTGQAFSSGLTGPAARPVGVT